MITKYQSKLTELLKICFKGALLLGSKELHKILLPLFLLLILNVFKEEVTPLENCCLVPRSHLI